MARTQLVFPPKLCNTARYHERFLTRGKRLNSHPAPKCLDHVDHLDSEFSVTVLYPEWLKLERVGETELTRIQTQSKCLAAFYMLGLLNRSIFIDLTQSDSQETLTLHFYV